MKNGIHYNGALEEYEEGTFDDYKVAQDLRPVSNNLTDKTKQELVNIIRQINPCLKQCYTPANVNDSSKPKLLKDAEKYVNEFNFNARLERIEAGIEKGDAASWRKRGIRKNEFVEYIDSSASPVLQRNDYFVCFFFASFVFFVCFGSCVMFVEMKNGSVWFCLIILFALNLSLQHNCKGKKRKIFKHIQNAYV